MPRTESYMKRHRPICSVLEEMHEIATRDDFNCRDDLIKLIEEALRYAKRMDAKLVEIRNKENADGKDG